MTDREERQRVIEILQKEKKTALHDNKWAFDYAIASIKTDLKYDLLYEETSGQADKNDLGVSSGLEKNSKKLENIATTKDYLGVDYLGVDCISRADALKLNVYAPIAPIVEGENVHWEEIILTEELRKLPSVLPSVTPIRPKGHWIEQIDHEENCRTLICSNCDRPALHDGDSIWKHKFCPHCGADMRGEEE